MMKREDWSDFILWLHEQAAISFDYWLTLSVPIFYILNPDKLLDACLEWSREHKALIPVEEWHDWPMED